MLIITISKPFWCLYYKISIVALVAIYITEILDSFKLKSFKRHSVKVAFNTLLK